MWNPCQSLALLAAAAVSLAAPISAQTPYPAKPVRMLVGYSPGSSTDIAGRIVAQGLGEMWKQPVVVENRGGAAGNIAADAAAKSAPDGYTILFAQNGLAISVAANPNLPFNGFKDLLPVAGVAATPHILVVNPNRPFKSVADLIAAAKDSPGKLSFGSSGIGNSDHMAGELFKVLAGIQALHVPYKGGAPAAADVMSGQLDFYFAGMPVGLPLHRSGRLRALEARHPGGRNQAGLAQAGRASPAGKRRPGAGSSRSVYWRQRFQPKPI